MRLGIEEIANYTHGVVVQPADPDALVTGITWDSREVKPGDLYIALPGLRVDGHDFVLSACESGAKAVLVSRALDEELLDRLHVVMCAVIQVGDTTQALTDLACGWRGHVQGRVVGITGSSGKTTTKNLVRDVLSSARTCVATRANQNNELGVPRTILAAEADTQAVVVEMGMRGYGQIEELCRIARPQIGLVSNIGTSHIELLGSRENIARAKGELLASLGDDGVAVVNAADDFADLLIAIAQERGAQVVLFNNNPDEPMASGVLDESLRKSTPSVWASDLDFDEQGRPRFTMNARGFGRFGHADADGAAPCELGLSGAHNVWNACSAAAVGLLFGMSLAACCAALAHAEAEEGRARVLESPDGVIVLDDAYNANPDSMRASLELFASMSVPGKRIAVLGDMGELGSYSHEGHVAVGRLAARSKLDRLICVGSLAATIAQAAREAGMPAEAITELSYARDAVAALAGVPERGDAVLVKASHSMELDRVVEGLMS